MLPLVLCFEIPNYDNLFLPFDPMLPSIQSIAQQYEVTFSTKGVSVTIVISQKVFSSATSCYCLVTRFMTVTDLLQVLQTRLLKPIQACVTLSRHKPCQTGWIKFL